MKPKTVLFQSAGENVLRIFSYLRVVVGALIVVVVVVGLLQGHKVMLKNT
jgi:hypothetical protein